MNAGLHPVDRLFSEMASVEPYPAGVVKVPARIPGIAFFPGGAGLWGAKPGCPLPPMPMGGIMVLGHDFHSEAGFAKSLEQGSEVPDQPKDGYRIPPTWVTLRSLFDEAGLALERCLFTNAYMGLRKGKGTTGRFPGSLDHGFVQRCRSFLLRQIEVQQPAVILTLGTWVPSFIAPLAPQLSKWRSVGSLRALDEAGPIVHAVKFPATAVSSTVAALTHPSLRGSNVGRRRYQQATGHEAELAILFEALNR